MSKIRPLGDRVVVKRSEDETKTPCGIVIPDTAAEKQDQGTVVALGPGKKDSAGARVPMELRLGDRVRFGKYAGQSIKVEDEDLMVMREEDIVAVIE
jgi:chaperonin GroES